MNKTLITDDHLGKLARKKQGFFGGLTGKIKRSDHLLAPYELEFKSGSRTGIWFLEDIEIIEEVKEDGR